MDIAFLFPAYGSQYVGRGKELYDNSRCMQEYFEEASSCLNINFVKLCFASSDVELGRMEHAYPALFLLGSALAAMLKQEGIQPNIVAGYDTGQWAALHAAGGINLPDGLYLLAKYAALYQEFLQSFSAAALRVHGVPLQKIINTCRTATSNDMVAARVAIIDSYDGHLVAGNVSAVDHVRTLLAAHAGATFTEADIELGLHSGLMAGIEANVRVYSQKVDFKTTSVPVIVNTHGKLVTEGDLLKENTLHLLDMPLAWDMVIKQLEPYACVVQMGPGDHLLAHVRQQYPQKQCHAINKPEDIAKLKSIVSSSVE